MTAEIIDHVTERTNAVIARLEVLRRLFELLSSDRMNAGKTTRVDFCGVRDEQFYRGLTELMLATIEDAKAIDAVVSEAPDGDVR